MTRLRGEGDADVEESAWDDRKIGDHTPRVDARPCERNVALAGWVTSGLSREQFGNHVLERDILDRDVVLITFNYRLGPLGEFYILLLYHLLNI